MDNPNIAFKRKKDKERRSVKLRNPTRTVVAPANSRINIAKVKEIRRSTGAGVSESVRALKRKGGSVKWAIAYIRNNP